MAINEEKFNLCARKRPAPRKILSSRPHSGIPSLCARNSRIGQGGKTAFVFPMLLQRCATVVEAADRISSRPRWGGGILMLADASGDIASLELSNTRSQLRLPSDASDVLFHTNAFFTEKMKEVELAANAYYTDLAP